MGIIYFNTITLLDKTKYFLEKDIDSFSLQDVLDLQKEISYHSDLYYNKQAPVISDGEYDKLFKKLEVLEEKFRDKLEYFQTREVGAKLKESSFKKVKHSRPMISLDNTYNEEDLSDFDERVKKNIPLSLALSSKGRKGIKKEKSLNNSFSLGGKDAGKADRGIEYTIEFKFDGLGVELIYKDGKLVQAITRGNGIEGEDVTQNVMQIDNIPKKIKYKDDLEVRGEVVMPISVFEQLNKQAKKTGDKVFSNPRNAASGSLRMKDNRITKQRKLKFFAYDLANFEEFCSKEKIKKYYDVIKDLEKLGFEISSYFEVCNGISDVINKIDNFGDLKNNLDFEIDGLVIKVNDISTWSQIGWTQHHPKYAIAYKFPAEILTTKIISVVHQVGRTGTITPVANLRPINIGGAIIKRATLHNYEEIENLGIAVGDYVFIKRAGEVIPKIISLAEKGMDRKKIEIPKLCPSCGTEIKKDKDKVRYYCPNFHSCPAQIEERLAYAVGKQGFNIDGLGEKQVKLFLKKGIINDLVDIFDLENKREEILALEGFQEKSVQNILESVQKSRNVDIVTLLSALSIFGVGKKTAKTLARLFKSREDIINFSYKLEDLEKLPDVGPEIAKNIYRYFTKKEHKEFLSRLISRLNISYYSEKNIKKGSVLNGKKVCITGSFEYSGKKIPRDELIKKLEDVGGEFVSSVSKKTDYLLTGEKAGSKLKKAKDLGVKILNLDEFMQEIS